MPPRRDQSSHSIFQLLRQWSQDGKTHVRSLAAGDRVRIRRLTENYRRLRQSRAALIKLHKQALAASDEVTQVLLLPPPISAKERK